MTGFTDEQIEWLRAPLSRENVKERSQANRTLSYIEGWVAINEANRIFGFDGWDRHTVKTKCVAQRERKIGQQQQRDGWQVSYTTKVRVVVWCGEKPIVREGTGYGSGIDADLGAAHESAIKEAETDAMKRALMTFGNQFGLALYDKTQAEVTPPQQGLSQTKAPVPSQAINAPNKTADHPRRQEALDAYAILRKAIEGAETLRKLDDLVTFNKNQLELIKQVHEDSYYRLLQMATAKRQEFLSGA